MKTPVKDKPAAFRGSHGTRLKYISDENLAKVQGGAQSAAADPTRKKSDTPGSGNAADNLHDAAAAASQGDAGHDPATPSGAGAVGPSGVLLPQPLTAHTEAADTDNDPYQVNIKVNPNAVAFSQSGADHAAQTKDGALAATDPADAGGHAAPQADAGTHPEHPVADHGSHADATSPAAADGHTQPPATTPYMDPHSANPAPGQSYADLRDKTVHALETARQNFANEVDAYGDRHVGTRGPDSGHGDTGGTKPGTPDDNLGDWMMVIPQQELSESEYRTLESAHRTVDAIRGLQRGLHELQVQEAMGSADLHDGESDSSQGPHSQAVDGTLQEQGIAPAGQQANDAFGKALAAQALVFESKVDNLINDLERDMPGDPDTAAHPAGHDAGGQPAAHAAPDTGDDWVIIEQPFAVPLSEHEAAQGAHDDMQKTTALNTETLKTQIEDALQHLTTKVDDQDAALSAAGTSSPAPAGQATPGHDDGEHTAPDAGHAPSGHDTPEEAPVNFTDEDSHHAMSQLPDGDTHQAPHAAGDADGAVDDTLMSMIKDRLPHLQDGKMALADAPKDRDDASVDDALQADLLKKMGDDADLVSADGGAFVTVTESHDTAPHAAGGQDPTGSNAGPVQTPAPIAVHDATSDTAHTAPADAPGTASFDHNVQSAEGFGQGLAPHQDEDAPMMEFGKATLLPEENPTPGGDQAEGHAPAHPAGGGADPHPAPPHLPAHSAEEDRPAHRAAEPQGHPVDEETGTHATAPQEEAHPGSTGDTAHPTVDETHPHGTPEEGDTHGSASEPAHGQGGTGSDDKPRTGKEVIDNAYGVIDQRQSTVDTGDKIGHATRDLPDGEKPGSHSATGTSSTDSVIVNADGVTVRTDQQAQAEAGGTETKGPVTMEGDVKAGAHDSGEVHVGPNGVDIKGQAGANVQVGGGVAVKGDLGHGVTGTAGVDDKLEAHADVAGRIGTKGVEGAAGAGATNTTEVGAAITADVGHGTTVTAETHAGVVEQGTAAVHGGLSDKGVQLGSGVTAGVYETVGTSITVGDDHYSGTAGADLHSPGAIGFSEDASATFNDGKVSFNIAGDIDLGIGGLAFHIGASIDVSGIEHKAEHAIENAARQVADILGSTAHTVEHALEQAGYTVAHATEVAAKAVANWFKSW